MVKRLISFLKQSLTSEIEHKGGLDNPQALQLAMAALMHELSEADDDVDADEQRLISEILTQRFNLSQQQLEDLQRDAQQVLKDSIDLHPFTRQLNAELSLDERSELIKQLWAIAFVDGRLDRHEHHLLRKLAGLLHIPENVLRAAKISAKTN